MKKVLFFLLHVLCVPMYGVTTVVVNQSQEMIDVLGYGVGCAGVVFGRGLMCGVKPIRIAAGESQKITYRTTQLGTQGGIIAQSLTTNGMYEKKAPTKKLQTLPATIIFPKDFTQIKAPGSYANITIKNNSKSSVTL